MNTTKKPLLVGTLSLTFAALTFAQLDEHKDDVDLLMTPAGCNFASAVSREALLNVTLASIAETHPDVTASDLKKNLDSFNFPDVINAIFSRNGFVGEEPATGEAKAATSLT